MTAATAHAWDSADAWTALQRAETTPHELAAIAAAHPGYATQIAAHPQAYPALVDWAEQVAAARRSTPEPAQAADVTDLLGGTRRASGAHPLAFSADADAWRAAVAAGSALTEGAGAGPQTDPPRAGDLAADRVAWTPGADLARAALGPAPDAAPDAAPAQPWWAGVSPAAPEATPATSAAAPQPAHRETFEPVGVQRAEAIAVGAAAGEATVSLATPVRPALPRQSAAAAARAAGAAYAAASAPAGTITPVSVAPAAVAAAPRATVPVAAVDTRALLAFVFAFVLAPMGVVFGHLALRDIATTGAPGRGYAVAGLIVGYAMIAATFVAAAITGLTLLAR